MHISQESPNSHTVRAYDEKQIIINDEIYTKSILINSSIIIPSWPVHSVAELTPENFNDLLKYPLEVIILGYSQPQKSMPFTLIQHFSKQHIGMECMSIGAACRTFNVLLSENRAVALGVIFP